ncbi:MAG: HEPN domain-containing protein [Ignavibacteriae bacterium]|nr:HEPN domain-containing protein [Ignavibacteriota bacterium]
MSVGNLFDQWLSKAEDDLTMAKRALRGKNKIVWSACNHSQQSAEKVLKAFLASKGIPPERTHDLLALNHACVSSDPEFLFLNDFCRVLNPYSVHVKYPAELGLTLSDAKQAIKAAEEVRSFVLRRVEATS